MRWDELFADLEGQLAAAEGGELAAEVADRTRYEAAQLSLLDRLAPAAGHDVRLHVMGVGQVGGRLDQVGAEWLLVSEAAGPGEATAARAPAVPQPRAAALARRAAGTPTAAVTRGSACMQTPPFACVCFCTRRFASGQVLLGDWGL